MRSTKGITLGYSPGPVPNDVAQIPRYLDAEFNKIASVLQLMGSLRIEPLATPPDKPRPGDLVYANGINWDPGSGAGVYYLNLNYMWTPLG